MRSSTSPLASNETKRTGVRGKDARRNESKFRRPHKTPKPLQAMNCSAGANGGAYADALSVDGIGIITGRCREIGRGLHNSVHRVNCPIARSNVRFQDSSPTNHELPVFIGGD